MRMRDAALWYARNGWAVFPCVPGDKRPAVKQGVLEATTEVKQVEEWWAKREYNIGVACGEKSGIWVLDVDGAKGEESLLNLGHGFPATLTQYTPSGGLHFVFTDAGGLGNTASSIGPGIDSRGTGGYILVWPSIHPNGGRYRWAGKQHPEPIPGWLIVLLRQPPKERRRMMANPSADMSKYVKVALESELDAVQSAVNGTRNHTLNRAAFNLGTLVGAGMLNRDEIEQLLTDAALASGLDAGEVTSTVARGLRDGASQPREVTA